MTTLTLDQSVISHRELTIGWLLDTLVVHDFNLARPFVVSYVQAQHMWRFEQPTLEELQSPGAGFMEPERQ